MAFPLLNRIRYIISLALQTIIALNLYKFIPGGEEAYKQPIFYVLGHFSKYFTPGSKRIDTQSSSTNVQTVSFQRPDDKIAVLIFNPKTHSVDIIFDDRISGKIQINIPPKSVHTIVYS